MYIGYNADKAKVIYIINCLLISGSYKIRKYNVPNSINDINSTTHGLVQCITVTTPSALITG